MNIQRNKEMFVNDSDLVEAGDYQPVDRAIYNPVNGSTYDLRALNKLVTRTYAIGMVC